MKRTYACNPVSLAEALGITVDERTLLLAGAGHPYHCTCDTCREWWRGMGPDPDTEEFGPFGKSLDRKVERRGT